VTGTKVCVFLISALVSVSLLAAEPPELAKARDLYRHTEYHESSKLLLALPHKDLQELQLLGQDYFMLGDYKKATETLEKALAMGAGGADVYLWLGRAYGRRAESAGPFTAPGYASHARKMLEKAVELDISNREATGDLLDFYLDAPSFLGGGMNKAEELAKRVEPVDPPESQYLMAQIEDKRKRYDAAEQHLRRAVELAPRQVGRLLALARHLAKHGRTKESDAVFAEAASIEPRNPGLVFYRAETYVESRRNLEDARKLLQEYVTLPLTPEDPPRESAQALLAKIQL
jgi:tetratricopeptide (TPR) repeat protein